MSRLSLEFEIRDSDILREIPNKYYDLINNAFESPEKVFEISSGVGEYHEPFTPLGKKKEFISYSVKSDGSIVTNAQFYKSPKKEKAILRIQLFSNGGEEDLKKFIKNFHEGFKEL